MAARHIGPKPTMKTGDSYSEESNLINSVEGFRVYRRRWLMLTIFIAFSTSVAYSWLMYASISDIVASYYGVSMTTVDMLGILHDVMYIFAIIPTTWLTEKKNLKTALLVGVSLQSVGSWVSFIGTSTQSIKLNFIGQILSAMAYPFTLGMSAQMAGTWFGINEVSLASGLGVTGCNIGTGLAFIIPPLVVQSGLDIDKQIKDLFLYTAIGMSSFLPLTIFVFEAKPPLPPSRPKMNVTKAGKHENYLQSVKAVLGNRNYGFLLISFALSMGILTAVSIKMKYLLSTSFTDSLSILGFIGIAKMVAGTIAPLIVGMWLDRSKAFRKTNVITILSVAVSIVSFAISLNYANRFFTTLSVCVYWLCVASLFVVCFEHAAELTYPESEVLSSGFMNVCAAVFTMILIPLIDFMEKYDVLVTLVFCCIFQITPIIFTLLIKTDNRRQNADRENYLDEDYEMELTSTTQAD